MKLGRLNHMGVAALPVIASEAKQSSAASGDYWIASSPVAPRNDEAEWL